MHPATGCVGKFQRRRVQAGWDEGEMKARENRGVGWQTRDSVCMHMYGGGGGKKKKGVCMFCKHVCA